MYSCNKDCISSSTTPTQFHCSQWASTEWISCFHKSSPLPPSFWVTAIVTREGVWVVKGKGRFQYWRQFCLYCPVTKQRVTTGLRRALHSRNYGNQWMTCTILLLFHALIVPTACPKPTMSNCSSTCYRPHMYTYIHVFKSRSSLAQHTHSTRTLCYVHMQSLV